MKLEDLHKVNSLNFRLKDLNSFLEVVTRTHGDLSPISCGSGTAPVVNRCIINKTNFIEFLLAEIKLVENELKDIGIEL